MPEYTMMPYPNMWGDQGQEFPYGGYSSPYGFGGSQMPFGGYPMPFGFSGHRQEDYEYRDDERIRPFGFGGFPFGVGISPFGVFPFLFF